MINDFHVYNAEAELQEAFLTKNRMDLCDHWF